MVEVGDVVWSVFQQQWHKAVALLPSAIGALCVLVVAWLVSRVARATVLGILSRGRFTAVHRSFFGQITRWIVLLVGLAIALDVMGMGGIASGLLAGGSITAVVLGFAFREIGENLLAGVLLAFSRPFEVGDTVESGDFRGAVREISLRTTHVRTDDGRDVHIPNAQIVNQPLVNYTLDGLQRPSFEIGVDYGADLAAAVALLTQVVTDLPEVLEAPAPRVVLNRFEGAWVVLTVAFWTDVKAAPTPMLGVRSLAMDACRRALRDHGYVLSNDTTTAITLATPTPLDVAVAGVQGSAA
ncbi:MAG: mechanosensitive ion channel family protein [Alphaproteobacteria bacterium]|nr:mechanosensitive ion channel family protein [Alphaproteobacteria bacterium]